jgi:hypothetical protein
MKIHIELNVYELNHSMSTGSFQALCTDLQAADQEVKKAPKSTPPPPETEKKTSDNPTTPTTGAEASSEISEVEIRAKFVELNKKGKKNELKELLTYMGVEKVSDLKPEQYQEAMEKLEAI